jgi:colanic acid/amylovoran biosynthesis glycosyltransferase
MMLILFTTSHPYSYGAERTFLEEELLILAEKFDRVILVPRYCRGERYPLPEGVEVDESYARLFSEKRPPFLLLLRSMFSPYFLKDLLLRPSLLSHPKAIARLATFLANAMLTRDWVKSWLVQTAFDPRELVFYTYWFDDASMGIGLLKREISDICVVSRAHGYDLYEERHEFSYWPCRQSAISSMDRVFPDSEAGLKYLQLKYPRFFSIYEASLLGVSDPGFLTNPSHEGSLEIVSCSRLVPVKRVDVLMEAVLRVALDNPKTKFRWTHFGEGDAREQMQAYTEGNFPPNATAHFPGYESQQALYAFYRDNPVDVFVNVSESEGTPVAVMEAVSCGIPVVATAVGGNVEIVSERNGSLLPPNPGPDEVATALGDVLRHREEWQQKRNESRRLWQKKYNAISNFTYFADALIALRIQRG